MGDRCYLRMRFKKADEDKIRMILGKNSEWDQREESKGNVEIVEYEANYAWLEERQAMAEAGIVFLGEHGAGGEYGGGSFVCNGRGMLEVRTGEDGRHVVSVDWNEAERGAEPDAEEIENAGMFYRMQEDVSKMLNMEGELDEAEVH